MPNEDILSRMLTVFRRRGGEAVTQLEHALQAATLARESDASPQMIAAALLHDIGHLLGRWCGQSGTRPGPAKP